MDPSAALPAEVFVEVLCFVSAKEVATSCALVSPHTIARNANHAQVSQDWNRFANNSALWREFVYQHYLEQETEGRVRRIEYQVDRPEVDRLEKEENGLAESLQSFSDLPHYAKMNEWKRYFVWRMSYEKFEWMRGKPTDEYALTISEDGKTCARGPGKEAHAHCWGERGWTKGTSPPRPSLVLYCVRVRVRVCVCCVCVVCVACVCVVCVVCVLCVLCVVCLTHFALGIHKWRITLAGFDSNGFWGALGVAEVTVRKGIYSSEGVYTGKIVISLRSEFIKLSRVLGGWESVFARIGGISGS